MKPKEQLANEFIDKLVNSGLVFDFDDLCYNSFIAGFVAGFDTMKDEFIDELLTKIERLCKQNNNQ